MYIARSRPQSKQRSASAHFADDLLVRLLHPSLHSHRDRCIDVQRARTGGKIGVESGIRWQAHAYIARSGANLPPAHLRALGRNVAAARFTAKCALNAPNAYSSGPGVQINVARSSFFQLKVTAARASAYRTCNFARLHIARTSLHPNLPRKPRELHISRTTLQIGVAMNVFDNLISRAGVGVDRGVDRNCDFIVHGNVAGIHVIDANAVPILTQRRMLFNFGDLGVPVSPPPGVSPVDFPSNRDRPRWSAAHNNVAGAGLHLEIHGPADLKSFLE